MPNPALHRPRAPPALRSRHRRAGSLVASDAAHVLTRLDDHESGCAVTDEGPTRSVAAAGDGLVVDLPPELDRLGRLTAARAGESEAVRHGSDGERRRPGREPLRLHLRLGDLGQLGDGHLEVGGRPGVGAGSGGGPGPGPPRCGARRRSGGGRTAGRRRRSRPRPRRRGPGRPRRRPTRCRSRQGSRRRWREQPPGRTGRRSRRSGSGTLGSRRGQESVELVEVGAVEDARCSEMRSISSRNPSRSMRLDGSSSVSLANMITKRAPTPGRLRRRMRPIRWIICRRVRLALMTMPRLASGTSMPSSSTGAQRPRRSCRPRRSSRISGARGGRSSR